MSFLLSSEVFAKRAYRFIEKKSRYVIMPWQMGIVARLMRVLPALVWDKLAYGKTRKPRHLQRD